MTDSLHTPADTTFCKPFIDIRFSEQGSNAWEKEENVYMMILGNASKVWSLKVCCRLSSFCMFLSFYFIAEANDQCITHEDENGEISMLILSAYKMYFIGKQSSLFII